MNEFDCKYTGGNAASETIPDTLGPHSLWDHRDSTGRAYVRVWGLKRPRPRPRRDHDPDRHGGDVVTAISYGRMARAYPSAGSAFTYVGQEINPALGYVAPEAPIDETMVPGSAQASLSPVGSCQVRNHQL
jgi:hypothetical protein